jgi:mannose-6-phosphate isomerase-like protein (cupin superfamily)
LPNLPGLLQSGPHLLVRNQAVENRQHLFAVLIDALQILPETVLEVPCFHPLIQHGTGYVDILAEGFDIVPSQKKAVKKGGFPLGSQGVQFISRRHKRLSENVSIPGSSNFPQVRFPALYWYYGRTEGATYVPTRIPAATRIQAAGNKPKLIDEYIGRVNSGTETVSVAHMRSPAGWVEPGQAPHFDEYTVVLRGMLRVEHGEGALDIRAGEAVIAHRGEWVRYSTPEEGGAEYIAVCLPAFSPETVHRDAE